MTFSWASFTIAARHWGVQAMQAASLVSVIGALLFLPPYLLFVDSAIPSAAWSDLLLQAIYQGAFAVVLSIYLFTRAARAIGPSRTAMLTAIMPVCAALLAIPVVGDYPTGMMILGIVLVTAGMVSAVLPATGSLVRSARRRPA